MLATEVFFRRVVVDADVDAGLDHRKGDEWVFNLGAVGWARLIEGNKFDDGFLIECAEVNGGNVIDV